MRRFILVAMAALGGCDGGVIAAPADAPRRDATATDALGTDARRDDGGADTDSALADGSLADSATVDARREDAAPDARVVIDAGNRCGEGPRECSMGPGTGEGDMCTREVSCFLRVVQDSVRAVIAANPTWFDMSAGTQLVTNVEGYMNGVVAEVNRRGLCAIRDPNAGDEMVVKHDNAFAENFDILSADNLARSGDPIYTSTCAPAWF
jgi:hypothetical protein